MTATVMMGMYKVGLGILAFFLARMGLLWMDQNSEFTLKVEGWNDNAKAGYYVGRLIAVAIVLGLVIG